jgi:uncharacterized phage-like protein YoqJ
MNLIQQTCFFYGHQTLPSNKIENIIKCLNNEIDKLISQGVTHFISGGVLGFDLIATSLIATKKEMGQNIHLTFALSYQSHDKKWTRHQKKLLHSLLDEADNIHYISEEYHSNCTNQRNAYMIQHSSFCVCALKKYNNNVYKIVKKAQKNGIHIINVVK